MTNPELYNELFGYINDLKRGMVLRDKHLEDNNKTLANYSELQMYKAVANLELRIRAMQYENKRSERKVTHK